MPRQAKPRALTKCPANVYAGPAERIVEFSFPEDARADVPGGLISLRNAATPGGRPTIELYRVTGCDIITPRGADAALIADLFAGALEELSLLRAIARAALVACGEVKPTKRGIEAGTALGYALVAYNGAPLMFKGRLNDEPDAPDYHAKLAEFGRDDPAFGPTVTPIDLDALRVAAKEA